MIYFFFQAEDGIRDGTVTGVQTCALPISPDSSSDFHGLELRVDDRAKLGGHLGKRRLGDAHRVVVAADDRVSMALLGIELGEIEPGVSAAALLPHQGATRDRLAADEHRGEIARKMTA